jgi:uncharacterized Zn-binding protein involved in type VI secretion
MPPAARVGDATSHGKPLGPGVGSANVNIGGRPAWRATVDMHICPLFDGPSKPHTGGMVLSGSTKVFINKSPAVRQGDQIIETGAVNMIVAGCPNVIIGG